MRSKLLCKFFVALTIILSIGYLIGCTTLTSTPTSELLATTNLATCHPSRIQTSIIKFPEIQGTMSTDGEMWALLFFDKAHAKEDVKIDWRITGSDKQFTVVARHDDGTVISPIWGPDDHGSSNWDRPGYEWGTGFNFPKPGCWVLTATRGKIRGEIVLDILAP
jgi:hypothetical protein